MRWYKVERDGYPEKGMRVLTYSEAYKGRNNKPFRIMNGQFVKMCLDVTHWCYIYEPTT